MTSASLARPLLLLVAAVAAVFACIPLAAHAGAITTVNEASMNDSYCSGSYIGRLTDIDTAYLPGDYSVPGRYCIQDTNVMTMSCEGADRGTTDTYDLYSSASIVSYGGSTSRNCSGIINMRQEPATVAAAYLGLPAGVKDLASLGKAGRLAVTGSIRTTNFNTIVYLAPSASLTGGTTVLSGNPAQLTWGSNLASPVSPYGSCFGINFFASGTSGSAVVYPTQTTTYGVTCSLNSAGNGSATSYQTVNVCSGSYGQSCSATSAANACGQTNTSYGSIQCNGSCSVGTPGAPANPAGYGNACTSGANSCGATNSGSIQCNGSCSVSTPGNPVGYGNSCTSAANSCGQVNAGIIQCNGSCSASTPANPAGYGNICTSAANACGQTNTGTIMCNGSCSVSAPPDASCTYPDLTAATVSPAAATAGVAVTLSATVTNGGNASTGVSFTDLFQKATDSSGTGAADIGTYASALLVAGSGNTASLPYTFGSAGTYYVRACADKSSAGNAGVIAESNENNNCGVWTAVTVAASASAPTATISASPSSITQGNGASLLYGCTNSTSAYIDNGVGSVPVPSGSKPVSPSSTTTYKLTCTGVGGSAMDTTILSVSAAACVPSSSVPISASYTFPASGIYYVRACANLNSAWGGSVGESNANNNCGAAQQVAIATPTVLLNVSPTSILRGDPVTLSWTSQNATSCTGNNFSTPGSPPNGSVPVYPAQTTTYSITCSGGASGVTGTSAITVTVLVGDLTLTANPTVVRKGDPTYLTWAATGSDVTACTLSGPGIPGGSYSGLSGTNQPATVTGASTYTLSCTAGASVLTQTVNAGLTPQFQEF